MHRAQPEPWGAAPTEPFSGHNSPDPLVSPLLGTVSSSPPGTGTGAGSHLPTREMSPRARDARGAAAKPPDPPPASQHGRRLERQRGERRGSPGLGRRERAPGSQAAWEGSRSRGRPETRSSERAEPGSDAARERSAAATPERRGRWLERCHGDERQHRKREYIGSGKAFSSPDNFAC